MISIGKQFTSIMA